MWQLAHCAVTTVCVWFQAVGRQLLKPWWQVSHDCAALTGMCWAALPVARWPLWQVLQVPGTTPAWSKLAAGIQAPVRWQLSQEAVVGRWLRDLPEAVMPLWQVVQLPMVTPEWVKRAPTKVCVLWQVSHDCVVGTCCCGITTLPRDRRMPDWWHEAQSRGVPLNTPLAWHDSQRASTWLPVRGNPVLR